MVREEVMNTVTNATAGAAIASPWWLHTLQATHEAVAFTLPFLGAAWIIIQMVSHFRKKKNEG